MRGGRCGKCFFPFFKINTYQRPSNRFAVEYVSKQGRDGNNARDHVYKISSKEGHGKGHKEGHKVEAVCSHKVEAVCSEEETEACSCT
jgi:hypothetical protein